MKSERDWTPIGTVVREMTMRFTVAAETGSEMPPAGCPGCGGVGYFKEAVPYGHPHFGVLFPCGCTLAAEQRRRLADLANLSNLAAFRDQTFATFDSAALGVADAAGAAWSYAQDPCGWLVLLGSYGVGKTHLAAAIVHAALERGERALLLVVPDLLDHLRAAFAPGSEVTYDARFEQIRTMSLLVLDDLGTEAATPWAKEKLYQLLNHRYQMRLPTVVTSNRTLDELEPRIASRLADRRLCQVLTIDAQDYRRFGGAAALERAVGDVPQKESGR